ncbi:MAG TPA: DinB family protein [Candidatus Bathyarchaeia archaeon]|nr:DinB family protein [Candidatus Bathyarchaeia archaeon]
MITDIASYLRYFDSVQRRTERDVAALPGAAAGWHPPAASGEAAWGIGHLVGHIGGARLYFASAYRGEGWIWATPESDPQHQGTWLPWLRSSADRYVALLKDTPKEWLTRRIEMIDTPGRALSGWRLLMMMLEHEVHHRSQIDSYAGLQGWPVPDIFGRSFESIDALQASERLRHGAS